MFATRMLTRDLYAVDNLLVVTIRIRIWPPIAVWLRGRVVRTLDLRSLGREFESRPLRYRVQPWASC